MTAMAASYPAPRQVSRAAAPMGWTNTPASNWGTFSPNALTDRRAAQRSSPEEDHMKFVHVATRTKDLEGAIKFYEQLGLTEKKRSELAKGKATLVFMAPEADNFAIELVYNWGKDDDYPGGERFGHFAFETEDIDAVLPVLELFGGRITRMPYLLEGDGPRLAFVDDPDGNSIELIQR
jgi:lactoylglutathione lyase